MMRNYLIIKVTKVNFDEGIWGMFFPLQENTFWGDVTSL